LQETITVFHAKSNQENQIAHTPAICVFVCFAWSSKSI